ncbi:MAG: membrane protein insertion efficiency factor YidD [Mariprofundales bacterium]
MFYIFMSLGAGLLASLWLLLPLSTMPIITPASFPIVYYQSFISPLDSRDCLSFPSCSEYAGQALAQHGLLLGSWLALDRLLHEGDDLRAGLRIRSHNSIHNYDPLARNTRWLQGENIE